MAKRHTNAQRRKARRYGMDPPGGKVERAIMNGFGRIAITSKRRIDQIGILSISDWPRGVISCRFTILIFVLDPIQADNDNWKELMRIGVAVVVLLVCSAATAENLEKTQKKELEAQ